MVYLIHMKFILGKKLHMSQRYNDKGVVPVTVIAAGPCMVTYVKGDRDGYGAVQIGYDSGIRKLNRPRTGHLKGLGLFRHLREFRSEAKPQRGQTISVTSFQPGDIVRVTGISKGKGFQGVVKRHKFSGGPKTHGHKDQLRMPGSIGSTQPKHVFKGTRMAGRMGGDNVSVRNLEVVEVDEQNNLLYIKGAVPGGRNGFVAITGEGEVEFIDAGTAAAKSEVHKEPEVQKADPVADEAKKVITDPEAKQEPSEQTGDPEAAKS